MDEQREAIRHSNRPLAWVLLVAAVGVFGLLLAANRGNDDDSSGSTSTTSSLPTTSTTVPIDDGIPWWLDVVDPEETDVRLVPVGGDTAVLLTGAPETDAKPSPRVRLLDMTTREVVWTAEGRDEAVWRSVDPIVIDGVVMIPDRPDEPEFVTSLLWGFDMKSGQIRFAVIYRNDVLVEGATFATEVDVAGDPVMLMRLGSGHLQRIDPDNGIVVWDIELRADFGIETTPAGELLVRSVDEIVALDPETGSVVGTAILDALPEYPADIVDGAVDLAQLEVGDGQTLLSWSFPAGAPRRAPGIALLDTAGEVVWEGVGRAATTWHSFQTFVIDGVVIKVDVDDETGSHGSMVAFDIKSGNRLWISQFRVPNASTVGVVSVSMTLRSGEAVLLTRTEGLGLVRVSPSTGSPLWSTDVPPGRIAGSVRRSDGSEAIAIVADEGNIFLDVDTGEPVSLEGP